MFRGTLPLERHPRMRRALIIATGIGVLSSTHALAESWCGYAVHGKTVVECGYSSTDFTMAKARRPKHP